MKKTILFFSILMFAFTGIYAQTRDSTAQLTQSTIGQTNFLGKWDITMFGLPQGDVKCQLLLNEKDGKLAGTLKFASPQPLEVAIVNPVIKDTVITFNATLQGYDVDYNLNQNKDGQLNGSMYNNMFVVTGKRSEAVDSVKAQ
ncbi:MAG: hypothetical protein ABI267_08220 [Ginsengibacter sp.]